MTQGKRYEPTDKDRAQVKMLTAMGIPVWDIAKVMQMSGPTLRKHFDTELALGTIEATAKVAQSLFKQATDTAKPNVTACIFWLKCRAGWREDSPQEGKKELAQQVAKTAEQGTNWDGLLQ